MINPLTWQQFIKQPHIARLTEGKQVQQYNWYMMSFMNVAKAGSNTVVQNTPPPAPTAPAAPNITSATVGLTDATINFTLSSDGGSAITNYQYSIDGGSTFTAFSPTQTSSPLTISNLSAETSYTIKIKAVNAIGVSVASNSVTITTSAYPVYTFVAFGTQYRSAGVDRTSGYSTSVSGTLDINTWYTASNSNSSVFVNFLTGSGVATNGDIYVAVGNPVSSNSGILYSSGSTVNGKVWKNLDDTQAKLEYRSVAYGHVSDNLSAGYKFVAVGSGSIAASTNGSAWNYYTFDAGVNVNGLNTVYNGQTGAGTNLWLTMGDCYATGNNARYGYSSADLTSWSGFATNLKSSDIISFQTIAFGDGIWVAGVAPANPAGKSPVWSSTDGINWTEVTSMVNTFTTACYAVAYLGNGQWVLGGDKPVNSIYTCDIIGDTSHVSSTENLDICYSLAYDGNIIAAVGKSGTLSNTAVIYSSDSGTSWSTVSSTQPSWAVGKAIASNVAPNMYPPI